MPHIVVLPKNIAELIAAGEVVERPSSVVKELCENAIDAGARSVIVELKDGGLSLIRVTDNGCGIARADVRNAFLRNATSKVATAEDLYAIATLGFRGEALPSIAAMSRVEMLTRTANELAGTRFAAEGGEETALEDSGCPVGTTFLVRDLFYNTPARLKFLKSNRAEGAAAGTVVEKLALSHPEVAFRLIREGVQEFSTPGDGQVLSCIRAIFSRELTDKLLPVSYGEPPLTLSGYISAPEAARGNRTYQNVFINGRFVKSRTCVAALEEAFAGHIMTGKFPACMLYLTMPYESIDVNVHPTKLEVRFVQEKIIFDLVYHGVQDALHRQSGYVQLGLSGSKPAAKRAAALQVQQSLSETDATAWLAAETGRTEQLQMPPATPVPAPPVRRMPAPAIDVYVDEEESSVLPAAHTKPAPPAEESVPAPRPPAEEPIPAPRPEPETTAAGPQARAEPEPPLSANVPPQGRLIGEAFATYMLVERGDSLLLIDKHAAHERLLYERLREENSEQYRQLLLLPVVLPLSREEHTLLLEQAPTLLELGFLIEDFGNQSVVVREAPAMLIDEDIAAMVLEILGKLRQGSRSLLPERRDDILHSMACRAAVKANDVTLEQELDRLLALLTENAELKNCPHGRPIYLELTRQRLEKEFGRLG